MTDDLLRAVAQQHAWLGLDGPPERVSRLARGESYDVVLAARGAAERVVRVARRPAADLPRPVVAEARVLERLPAGVGPRLVAVDVTGGRLGRPALVESRVLGAPVLDPTRWDDALLDRLAQVLARLHREPWTRCGPVDDPRGTTVSVVASLEAGLGWWLEHHPDVVADPEVLALLPRVRDYLARREPAFEGVRRFALVHGDLVATRVLVHRGEPRLVGWERSEVDDPARDLGVLGGDLAAPGVQVALRRGQVERLVSSYLAHAPADLAAQETPQTLLERRDAWAVHEALLASLRHRRRAAHAAAPDACAGRRAAVLTAQLHQACG